MYVYIHLQMHVVEGQVHILWGKRKATPIHMKKRAEKGKETREACQK